MSKRLNRHKNILIELKEGEIFCKKCNGKGLIPNKRRNTPITTSKYLICNVCLGDGKIDWVENVTGKKIF